MNSRRIQRATAMLNEVRRSRRERESLDDAGRSLVGFLEASGRGSWQRAPHLDYLCDWLEGVVAGTVKRLMVFLPPRHGKSQTVSRGFPAYYLGRHPEREIILASYGAELAYDFSRKARAFVNEYGGAFDPPIAVSRDSFAVNRWSLTNGTGGLTAAGAGGPLTGRGASVAIIDDPFKDWASAQSKTIRDGVWDWYQSVLYTRLAPGGAIILVQTRWHEDDLAGRLLKAMGEGGESWEVVSLPAIAEASDVLGRTAGEPLWEERYDATALDAIERAIGPAKWAALYQQRPYADGGGLFKRSAFRYYDLLDGVLALRGGEGDGAKHIPLSACWLFQTVDPAATTTALSDYFAAATWAVTPDSDLVLLDLFRERAETVKHIQIMDGLWAKWRPKFQAVENRTFGLSIIQELKRRGRPVVPCKADQDKYSRALPLSSRYEIGAVYHPSCAAWLETFESELVAFPSAEHDDCVDVAAYAAIVLAQKGRRAVGVSKVDLEGLGF